MVSPSAEVCGGRHHSGFCWASVQPGSWGPALGQCSAGAAQAEGRADEHGACSIPSWACSFTCMWDPPGAHGAEAMLPLPEVTEASPCTPSYPTRHPVLGTLGHAVAGEVLTQLCFLGSVLVGQDGLLHASSSGHLALPGELPALSITSIHLPNVYLLSARKK